MGGEAIVCRGLTSCTVYLETYDCYGLFERITEHQSPQGLLYIQANEWCCLGNLHGDEKYKGQVCTCGKDMDV